VTRSEQVLKVADDLRHRVADRSSSWSMRQAIVGAHLAFILIEQQILERARRA
jgi:hypothetical protein